MTAAEDAKKAATILAAENAVIVKAAAEDAKKAATITAAENAEIRRDKDIDNLKSLKHKLSFKPSYYV